MSLISLHLDLGLKSSSVKPSSNGEVVENDEDGEEAVAGTYM